MITQLTKAQIDAIRVELAQYGLFVTDHPVRYPAKQPVNWSRSERKPKNVQQVLAKSKWYRRPSMALSAMDRNTTARRMTDREWKIIRESPEQHGYCFPYRSD